MRIWTVAFVNDDMAEEFGAWVFHTEQEAQAAADKYLAQSDNDGESRFVSVQFQEFEVV